MSARITAAEAAAILRDLARGREDGNGADVWPLDRSGAPTAWPTVTP